MNDTNLIVDLARISKKLMINDIFYGLFLSTISKKSNKDIPVAAVGVNKSTMDFTLYVNPDEWFKFSDEVKFGILNHEAKHLTMFHLITSDLYPNHKMDNLACDIEINQTIDKDYLPSYGIFLKDFEEKYPQLNWKKLAGRDHYYKELNKLSDKEKEEIGIDEKAEHHWIITDGEGNQLDPNSLTDAEKNALRVQLESTIEQIAEEVAKTQGSLPSEIDQLIKGFKKPKPKFNYSNYIRNYIGNSTKYLVGSSKLRENQRFPGQPKIVLKPQSKILVAIDQSGSVSTGELYEFLNEIAHLSKKFDIEIRAFDTQVYPPTKYKAGSNEFRRTACGGTDFDCVIDFYNKSQYNSCLVFTDGHAGTPNKCHKRLLWVISSNGTENSIKNNSQWIKIPLKD